MISLTEGLTAVRERIRIAANHCGRNPNSIELIAVSKTFPASAVKEVLQAGQTAFGENYVQEAIEKIQQLDSWRSSLTWHFIGPLQSNKTSDVARYFDWIHTVDRQKIAQRLSEQRQMHNHLPALSACVQVNISKEVSKSGVHPEQAIELCQTVASLPGLVLRGLMTIPAPSADPKTQRHAFAAMRQLFENIREQTKNVAGFEKFDTLSMGMSDDLEAAIAEGATMVRVGSAIFGNRPINANVNT